MDTKKVALITGASRGIGRECATVLHEAGYNIAFHYAPWEEEAIGFVSDLQGCKAFKADLADPDSCKELVRVAKLEMGRIDVLVNNAGISIDQVITFAKYEDFEKILSVNLKSVFNLSKLVSKVMIKQKGGRIINISSVVGFTGNLGQSMYAASKGAVGAFTKSIAKDLAQFGILANSVAPGFIDTAMTKALKEEVREELLRNIPLKRLGSPRDVANVVEFLSSEKSGYITGSTIHVNGGMYTN